MFVLKPKRGDLIAAIPLFIRIEPLQRPRLNRFSKTIYQPSTNQKSLLADISNFAALGIAVPCIVDTHINFEGVVNQTPHSKKYGDEDNCRKAILDALVHAKILSDDRYVLGGENFKAFGEEDLCLIEIWGFGGIERYIPNIRAS